jgi:DNA-binding transcriptional regulator YiaG
MIAYMGRDPAEQATPEFSTDTVRDKSVAASPKLPAATESAPQRYILPKNLRNAVKHLSDGELDLMHAATLEEMKRRGRTPQGAVGKSVPTEKRRHVDTTETPLTRGQINAVRAAFKAGITPSRIARQFGISQSNVRKALASDESIR